MTKSADRALHRDIRIVPEQWRRIESAAAGTVCSSNQLLVELAMEALDRRKSLGPEAEPRVAVRRASPRAGSSPTVVGTRFRKSATSSRTSCPIPTPAPRVRQSVYASKRSGIAIPVSIGGNSRSDESGEVWAICDCRGAGRIPSSVSRTCKIHRACSTLSDVHFGPKTYLEVRDS